MEDTEWQDLKEKLKDPEYVEEFVTAAIQLILSKEKND